MRAVKAGAGKERVARAGALESRTAVRGPASAISTQVSLAPPEYVDLDRLSDEFSDHVSLGREHRSRRSIEAEPPGW